MICGLQCLASTWEVWKKDFVSFHPRSESWHTDVAGCVVCLMGWAPFPIHVQEICWLSWNLCPLPLSFGIAESHTPQVYDLGLLQCHRRIQPWVGCGGVLKMIIWRLEICDEVSAWLGSHEDPFSSTLGACFSLFYSYKDRKSRTTTLYCVSHLTLIIL